MSSESSSEITGTTNTAWDSLTRRIVAVTTVGQGECLPVTNAQRLVGIIVVFIGMGLLGVLIGFPANVYFSPGTGEVSAAMVPVYPNRQIDEFRRLQMNRRRLFTDCRHNWERSRCCWERLPLISNQPIKKQTSRSSALCHVSLYSDSNLK